MICIKTNVHAKDKSSRKLVQIIIPVQLSLIFVQKASTVLFVSGHTFEQIRLLGDEKTVNKAKTSTLTRI